MTAKILLAPVAAGKTERILNTTIDVLERRPLGEIWVLLATKRQEHAFRQRLVEWNSGRNVFFNVEFFNFYELYQRLLDMAGKPQRRLHDSARYALLRNIINTRIGQLQVYHTIADTPGFVRIVADFIYELKQNRIYPEKFEEVAETAKDHDLALIYSAYQQTLQSYNLVDKEGEGWLAVAELTRDNSVADNLTALLVDGFDQFTPVQADLLALLSERAEETVITLTHVAGREQTIGRRFQQALDQLQDRIPYPTIEAITQSKVNRQADIQHLIANIFRLDAESRHSDGGMRFIEAPDKAEEVGAVMRQIKHLLLQGTKPDQILVALRDWEGYRGHFSRYSQKYALPMALHYGEPLSENPVVIALFDLLKLHQSDFRRRDLLDVLRSQYFRFEGITSAEIDLLDRISRVMVVTGGRGLWLDAVELASKPRQLEEDSDEEAAALVGQSDALSLVVKLEVLFNTITPPQEATLPEFVYWLETLIGEDVEEDLDEGQATDDEEAFDIPLNSDVSVTLGVLKQLRDDAAPDEVISRDLAAMQEFKNVLRHLLSANELLRSLDRSAAADPVISWELFFRDLVQTVENAAINPRPNRAGRVLVTTVTDARGLPHEHVFVVGLSEGLFPTPIPEDPLYLDSERRQLSAKDPYVVLQTQGERAADDGLFYELICLPHETLTLSRPTMQEGKIWLPSPLWQASLSLFEDAETLIQQGRIGLDRIVDIDSVATRDEAMITVVDALNRTNTQILPKYHWLTQHEAEYTSHIRAGHSIESDRLLGRRFNRYSGRIESDTLREIIAKKLNFGRVWSASQLNEYGVCGFRFFAGRLLRLQPLEEPEEGMDVLQRGTLHHDILEKTYTQLRDRGLGLQAENLGVALDILGTVAEEMLDTAPQRMGFRAGVLWDYEKQITLRKLQQFVRLDFDPKNPLNKAFGTGRTPYILEADFGYGADVTTIELGGDIGAIKIRGRIDRVDRLGNGLILIDYKTGSSPIPASEMEAGRNFQMMVYLEGAKSILGRQTQPDDPHTILGGAFWHINASKKDISGTIHLDEAGNESMDMAKGHLVNHISRGRQGDFAVHASKPDHGRCVKYCDFAQLCRMSSANRRKE